MVKYNYVNLLSLLRQQKAADVASLRAVELVAAFTSSSFGIGFFGSSMNKPKTFILRQPPKDDSNVTLFAQNFKFS